MLSPSTAPADSPLPGVPLVLPSTVSAGVAPRPHVLLPGRGVIKKKKEKKKTQTPNQPAARAVSCLGTEGQVLFEPLMGAGGSARGTWQLSAPAAELSACAGVGATWCGLLAGPPLAPVPWRAACPSQVRLKAPSHVLSRSPRCQLSSFSPQAGVLHRVPHPSQLLWDPRGGEPPEGTSLPLTSCPAPTHQKWETCVHLCASPAPPPPLSCQFFGTRPIPCPSSDV